MSSSRGQGIEIKAAGTALQQMCNYVAIADTKDPGDVLRELVLHTLFTFAEDRPSNARDVAGILNSVFGVSAPDHQVQDALDRLVSTDQVSQPFGASYILTKEARSRVTTRIDQAAALQDRVKSQWLAENEGRFPSLDAELAWGTLQDYLAKAFLRHGMQVAIFLDPSVDLPAEYATSLSTLLDAAVRAKFSASRHEEARHAISEFLASVGGNPERAQFIAECADGAANFFSLAVAPEAAGSFREELGPMILFCDTNFLFGILDLHVHPMVDVSNELLDAIVKHRLPVKLRYHAATLRELQASIAHYGDVLRRRQWPRALSRAATSSRFMSGIELKYHEKNAEAGVDVETFLKPYQHVDVLLKRHSIDIYRQAGDRLTERATLEAEYKEFLARLEAKKQANQRSEKPHELIAHDAEVLDCVHWLREKAESTVGANALFVTCDYSLYRFDSDASRQAGSRASVVLPNVLWQILRPYISQNPEFDRSFAETFAIPEFRTIGSGAARACSRMLSLLATYRDFPEATAVRLLSNDVLVDQLRATQYDAPFQALVDSAVAAENQTLLEDRAALEKQVIALRSDKELAEQMLERQGEAAAAELARVQSAIAAKERESDLLGASQRSAEASAEEARAGLAEMAAAKLVAEQAAADESEGRRRAEAHAVRTSKYASTAVASFAILVIQLLLHSVWRWEWLLRHPNSYTLQACLCLMVAFGVVGLWVRPWRKALWITGIFGVASVLLGALGGPQSTP